MPDDAQGPAGAGSQVARASRFRWRRLLPWAGLLLFGGCLWALLSGGSWRVPLAGLESANGDTNIAVVIDPGHGGADSGAVAQGVVEKDLNLDVGCRVAQILETHGLKVKLTRADDHFVPLEARVALANALPGAVFVSIHFNDANGEGHAVSRASGIETYYSGAKQLAPAADLRWALFGGPKPAANPASVAAVQAGMMLAGCIQRALISGTAATDRGIKEAGYFVTRRVRGPAVLVEGGFVSHPQEAQLLLEPAYRQKIANSIAGGILRYLQTAPPAAGASSPPRA